MMGIITIIGVIAAVLLGGTNPLGMGNAPGGTADGGAQTYSGADACRPTVNTNRMVKVQINNSNPDLRPVYGTDSAPGGNKEEKTWVLVKENAPIPAWKVELIARANDVPRSIFDPKIGEMERMGTTIPHPDGSQNPDAENKDVYIGVGWCNPQTGGPYLIADAPGCLDPLVQDVVFVLVRKGAVQEDLDGTADTNWLIDGSWGSGTADPALYDAYPRTRENIEKYWWEFNVYYDASKLPANPTYDNLPDWMKLQCPDGGDVMGYNRCRQDPDCRTILSQVESSQLFAQVPNSPISNAYQQILSATSSSLCDGIINGIPCLVINQQYMDITTSPSQPLAQEYIAVRKVEKPTEPPYSYIGTAYTNHFRILYRESSVVGTTASHILILDPIGHPEGPWYEFAPNTFSEYQLGNSLQLGSFTPGIPSFYYEWWTPSCKPAIYLYPEQETELTVSVKPKGYITESIPHHGKNGWNVIAQPNGTLSLYSQNNAKRLFPYLYYEAAVSGIQFPKDRGWIRTENELIAFFHDILPKLGLYKIEQKDFIDYWIPKLTNEGNTWFITLIDRSELDRIEPVDFSINPDTFIRVRFYFENIDHNPLYPNTTAIQLPPVPIRKGFTAVDWGGIIGNGSCGISEISQ